MLAFIRAGVIRQFCKLQDECPGLLRAAMGRPYLLALTYYHLSKLARTIADGGCEVYSVQ
jgi:predicted ATPase with chaperone activity